MPVCTAMKKTVYLVFFKDGEFRLGIGERAEDMVRVQRYKNEGYRVFKVEFVMAMPPQGSVVEEI